MSDSFSRTKEELSLPGKASSLDTEAVITVNSHHNCSLPGREDSQMNVLKG